MCSRHSCNSDVMFLFVRSRRDATRECYTWQCGCFQYVALSSWQSCRILRSGPLYSVATWHHNSIVGLHARTWLSSIITNDIIRIIYGGALRIESRITIWAISMETSRPPCPINSSPRCEFCPQYRGSDKGQVHNKMRFNNKIRVQFEERKIKELIFVGLQKGVIAR